MFRHLVGLRRLRMLASQRSPVIKKINHFRSIIQLKGLEKHNYFFSVNIYSMAFSIAEDNSIWDPSRQNKVLVRTEHHLQAHNDLQATPARPGNSLVFLSQYQPRGKLHGYGFEYPT